MRFLSKLKNKNFSKETVLLRVDLNVERLEDSLRLEAILPTLKWLTERNAKIVILSHLGRPNIHPENQQEFHDPSLTLQTSIPFISKNIGRPVYFFDNFNFEYIKNTIKEASSGSVFMLENLRFLSGEEANSAELAKALSSLGTLYINDAFAVSHRKNASIAAITRYLPSYAGLLFEKEYTALKSVLSKAAHPLIFIIGGAKTADKLPLIKNFLRKADIFLLGGGPANTFLKSKGVDIEQSIFDPKLVSMAKRMLSSQKVIIPEDWVMEGGRILDIGLKTINAYAKQIVRAKTVVWNGPLGYFENSKYARGSTEIAFAIAKSGAFSLIGGGETTQFIRSLGLENKISFLSTAGGAMLEFLAGKKLPGVEALK